MQADREDQKRATDEYAPSQVLASMARNPTEETRHLYAQMGISQNSVIMRILRVNK